MKLSIQITLMLFFNIINAQYYDVIIYDKISDNSGGLEVNFNNEDWFGYSVEGIGDLNGDGVNDVAVGSLKDDDGGYNKGAVYILFLNEDGSVNYHQKISDTEGVNNTR